MVFMRNIPEIINVLIRQQTPGHVTVIKANGDDENCPIWFFCGSVKGKFQLFMKKPIHPNCDGRQKYHHRMRVVNGFGHTFLPLLAGKYVFFVKPRINPIFGS